HHGHHGKGQHHQRDVPMPAVPGPRLVVIEPKLRLGGLERILNRPAPPLDAHKCLDRCPGRAPGREKGELPLGQAAPDQESPRPGPPQGRVELVGFAVRQPQVTPVIQPRPFAPFARRQAHPRRRLQTSRDGFSRAGHRRLADPGVEGLRGADPKHVALAGSAQRHLAPPAPPPPPPPPHPPPPPPPPKPPPPPRPPPTNPPPTTPTPPTPQPTPPPNTNPPTQ